VDATLGEDVKQKHESATAGENASLLIFGGSVSLEQRRRRIRAQRRQRKLRALGGRVTWTAIVLAVALLLLAQWVFLRPS